MISLRRSVARLSIACAGTLAFLPLLARAAAAPASIDFLDKPVLIECEPGGGEVCFQLRFGFLDAEGKPAAVLLPAGGALAQRIELEADGHPIVPYYAIARQAAAAARPRQLTLLLLDNSGSMLTDDVAGASRFAAARQAAAAYLGGFVDGQDRVAVVPFSAKGVQAAVDGAPFVTTRAAAQAELDALPAPQPRNDTALYSAVADAAQRLAAEAQASGAQPRLLVLTDGANDVQPAAGDDPGLLSGNAGLAQAVAAVLHSHVPVLPIGLGTDKTVDVPALTRLGTQPPLITTDPAVLRRAFLLPEGNTVGSVTVAIKAPQPLSTRNLLAGRLLRFRAKMTLPDGTILVEDRPALWAAPPVATPQFLEVADEAEQRAYIDSARVGESSPWLLLRPVLVFAGFAVLLLLLWNMLPRWIWPERYGERSARPLRPEYWPGQQPPPAAAGSPVVPRPVPPGFERGVAVSPGAARRPTDHTIVKGAAESPLTKTRLN